MNNIRPDGYLLSLNSVETMRGPPCFMEKRFFFLLFVTRFRGLGKVLTETAPHILAHRRLAICAHGKVPQKKKSPAQPSAYGVTVSHTGPGRARDDSVLHAC